MRLLLATRSADKAREIGAILGTAVSLELLTLDQLQVQPSPEEDQIEIHDTFWGNALAKARYYARTAGIPALADDSGLVVDALAGAPGVRTKRFSGRSDLSGAALDHANNALLLQRLEGVPAERRSAHFVCVAALARPDRPLLSTVGTCAGLIAHAPRGERGFGYDPLFLLPDLGVTFAELTPGAKNRRSHRARAFRAMAARLRDFLPEG